MRKRHRRSTTIGALYRHSDALQHLAPAKAAAHRPPAHRDPIAAFHIHRRAIGPPAVGLAVHLVVKLHPGAAVGDCARGHIKAKPVDALPWGRFDQYRVQLSGLKRRRWR